jgi:hypothetical protein
MGHPSNRKRTENRTLRDRKRWRPLVSQDVKTDRAVRVDVGVINLGSEADFRRLEGIVRREGNREEKDTASVRRIALGKEDTSSNSQVDEGRQTYGTHDCCLPLEHVVTSRSSRTGRWGIAAKIDQFLKRQDISIKPGKTYRSERGIKTPGRDGVTLRSRRDST